MASQVILKKSSVAARVPVVGDLAFGELALNYQDGLLYYKKADGTTISTIGGETTATIKTKLGISTLSGSNTGDQTIPTTLPNANAVTFTSSGGAAAGSTYTGAAVLTVDYSTIGAAASGHTHSYQAADGDLLAIGGLTGTTGLLKKTAADTWTLDTTAYTTNLGTVTSVATSGGYGGLTLTGGTITTTGTITMGGTPTGTWPIAVTGRSDGGVKFWSASHPTDYYTVNNWDGTYWSQTSNHGAPVRVGRSDSSASADSLSGKSQVMYYEGFTLDANTMSPNSTGFSYSNNAPCTGPIVRFSANTNYDMWLSASYSGGGNNISFRTKNGDAGTINPWRNLLHDNNYNSYSPTLTGGSASGTWGISVTGTSGSISGFNNPVTAPTASTIVYRDAAGDISAREIVLSSGLSAVTPTVLVSMYPATNQMVRTTPAAVAAALSGQAMNIAGSATSVTGGLKTINGSSIIGSGDVIVAATVANFTATTSANPSNVDSPVTLDVIGYCSQAGLPFSQGDGGLYSAGYSTAWYHQIYGDFRSGQIAVRGKNSGTWQAWRTVLDSSNYTSYSPTLTGDSASGTWGISITGSSASTTGNAATASKTSSNSGYVRVGTGMAPFYNWGGAGAGGGAPSDSTYTTGIDIGSHPSDQSYGFQIACNMFNGAQGLWTRAYNSGFTSWVKVLDSSNYSSYALPLSGGTMTGSTTIGTSNYIRFGPNPTWASTLQVGGDGVNAITRTATIASVVTTNGNLHLDSGSDKAMYLNFYSGTGGMIFGNGALGQIGSISSAGALTMNSNITAYSDERLKKDWSLLPSDFVQQLSLVKVGTYTRIDSNERQVGVSAQSLKNLMPEAVIDGEYLSVAYGNAALASAVELAKEVVSLNARIARLEALVSKLIEG
jgi:hypothetical protein